MAKRLDSFVIRAPRLFVFLLLALLAACALGQSNTPPTASLSLPSGKAKPGDKVSAKVIVTFADGLHAYQNPPSEDYLIPVTVKSSSKDITLVKVTYPKGVDAIVGGSTKPDKVYEGTITIPIVLGAPKKAGDYAFALSIGYQQCNSNNCFPPSSVSVSGKMSVAAPTKPAAPDKTKAAPPATVKTPPTDKGTSTAKPPEKQPSSKPQPPATEKPANSAPVKKPAVAKPTPQKTNTTSPGAKPSPAAVEKLVPRTPPTTVSNPSPNAATASRASTTAPSTSSDSSSSGFIGDSLKNAFQQGNYFVAILLAMLTGLALAATPCVYPMIPITVGFFSNQTAGSRAGRVGLGLMYMLGLAVTYGAVGGVSAALGGTIGSLFQAPWFLFALAVFMAVLALSMFDVYEIRLPAFLGKQIHGRSGAVGALVMGLLMGFAAAPCAGPVVTAYAVKVAELKNVPLGLVFFTSIGLGLGLPFFAIGAFASGAKTLPRAGGWLKTLKALLGIVVLYVALNYLLQAFQLKSDDPKTLFIQAIFLVLAALYLFLFEHSGDTKLIWGMKGAAILLCGLMAGQYLSDRSTAIRDAQLAQLGAAAQIQWQKFTPEAFEVAKKSGRPIVIDASANWCAICHEIEDAVFNKPQGIAAMQGVIALQIDQSTGVDQKYVQMTNEMFHIKGLPHIEVLKPGGAVVKVITGKDDLDSPEKLQQYLAEARS